MSSSGLRLGRSWCRKLGYGTWKETLYVYKDGKVYPSATPIVAVTVPAGQTMIEGNGVWIGWQNNYPLIAGYGYGGGSFPPQANIVYTGGYQPAGTTGGVTPAVPMKLRDAICWVAYRMLHPIVLPGVPHRCDLHTFRGCRLHSIETSLHRRRPRHRYCGVAGWVATPQRPRLGCPHRCRPLMLPLALTTISTTRATPNVDPYKPGSAGPTMGLPDCGDGGQSAACWVRPGVCRGSSRARRSGSPRHGRSG